MQHPVMQQEWQRRQTQRSVWALLGLLAVVSGTAARDLVPPATAPGTRIETAAAPSDSAAVVGRAPAEPGAARSSTRYWRQLAPAQDAGIRLRLLLHAEPRPAVSSHALWLRRFLRPPTA